MAPILKFNQIIPSYLYRYFEQESTPVLETNVKENLASCHDCRMSKSAIPDQQRYKENLKCCSFWPDLSNHQIGAISLSLSKHNSFNKQKTLIFEKRNSNPLGLRASNEYKVKFDNQKNLFGQVEELLCPYFDRESNQCGIWLHRGGVCSGYFCASDKGELGLKFWSTLAKYQSHLEFQLAQYVLPFLGLSSRSMKVIFEVWSNRDETFDFSEIWDDLDIQPLEFYKKSYQHLQSLANRPITDQQLIEILGSDGVLLRQEFLRDIEIFKG